MLCCYAVSSQCSISMLCCTQVFLFHSVEIFQCILLSSHITYTLCIHEYNCPHRSASHNQFLQVFRMNTWLTTNHVYSRFPFYPTHAHSKLAIILEFNSNCGVSFDAANARRKEFECKDAHNERFLWIWTGVIEWFELGVSKLDWKFKFNPKVRYYFSTNNKMPKTIRRSITDLKS